MRREQQLGLASHVFCRKIAIEEQNLKLSNFLQTGQLRTIRRRLSSKPFGKC
jgi:hypothetical protein